MRKNMGYFRIFSSAHSAAKPEPKRLFLATEDTEEKEGG
jgi:hypothetical protein